MSAGLHDLHRRRLLGLLAGGALASFACSARAETPPEAIVYRDPTCGCCHKWVEHLRANGFAVTVRDSSRMAAVKAQFGVPKTLASCHTAEIGGYVIEGHVPADAIRRLLDQKPRARGLSVPGMPIGSPGMEGPNPEVYEVILFGEGEPRRFGRYFKDKAV